ncbi:MAG: gliding motility-associated C-terminal domain-containing protein [Cytophagaceae bacterium]
MKSSLEYRSSLLIIILVLILNVDFAFSQACDASTPSFTFSLAGNPNGVYTSPSVSRSGLCCGLDPNERPPIRCIEFFFTLDTGAAGIRFDIASGAIPPGSLGYQINCGPYHMVGENICLDGPGPHRLTFCKPGNNQNTYTITSIPKPSVSPPIYVSDGCIGSLTATGYQLSTIIWRSVGNNPVYNSYLSCTTACSTVVVTAQAGYPPYVDYEVSGVPLGGCNNQRVANIARVYFVTDKTATILPEDPTICYGGVTAAITAHGTGGLPPYNYLWSTGETTQTINTGVGTYTVRITDQTNCPPVYATTTVTAHPSPIIANAGPDVTSCANNPSVVLNGSVTMATGGSWSGGNGTYSPSNTSLVATYTPTAAEISAGSVRHILVTTGNGSCPASRDTTFQTILPAPIVNAGPNVTVCGNNASIQLNGSVNNATGGTWSGGSGTFYPNPNTLNAVYQPSAEEITNGTVTLTLTSTGNGFCNPVSANMTISITPAPTVDAGSDIIVCANNSVINLSGTVTIATGGQWSGGTGTFSNPNSLTSSYTPSTSEIINGVVTLTLTSTGNGQCLPVTDQVQISITPAPTVNAGSDLTVCTNNLSINLNGTVTVASGGLWSGGNGTFNPGANSLSTNYTPSETEINSGTVTLTLTSTGNGNCNPVSDQMVLTILQGPVVDAGPDQFVCENNSAVDLSATVTNATGGTWMGMGGTFSPSSNNLNTRYFPSQSEISSGFSMLTLTSTGNGLCPANSDTVFIVITAAPRAIAGPPRTICANNPTTVLNGIIQNAVTGTWSGGTGSFSPNANTLNATYTASPNDIAAGVVTLTLTANYPGCLPVSNNLTINISPAPVVDAGADRTVCQNNASVNLNGNITIATGGIWSGGTGTFSPNNTTLNATYIPSAGDLSAGNVTLTLTSTGNGNCNPVADQMVINFTPAPTVFAGVDQTICSNNSTTILNGSLSVATGGTWSGGSGTFSPNANSLNVTYIPSATEIQNGSVNLTLTTTGNGNCNPVSDQMVINFTPAPVVNPGPEQSVCANNPQVRLQGSVTVAGGGIWTGGSGTWSPANTALTVTYNPTPTEINNGFVNLTLTSTGNGNCNPVSNSVRINITPAPTINAGADQVICGSESTISLQATATVATGGTWSTSGTGTFTPSNNLISTYNITAADRTAGVLNFTITSTGHGNCLPVTDNLRISFTAAPTVNAGPDQDVCTNNLPVRLAASGSPGSWSGGAGTFSPSATAFNAVYTPTQQEIESGAVTLTFTTHQVGACNSISDQVTIVITQGPFVQAGSSQTICADRNTFALNGIVTQAQGGTWTTNGSGTFSPDANTLNANYNLSEADKAAGSVTLRLTATGQGSCSPPVYDELVLTITPAPTINAGPDRTICADASSVNLSAIVTIASGVIWTSSGTGTFAPGNNSLTVSYTPSLQDRTNGSVILTATTAGTGNCNPISDDVNITITPAPTVNAGNNQTICADRNSAAINGTVTIATGGVWTTSGSGAFTPNANSLNASYIPSNTDKISGGVNLTLTSTGNGTCQAVSHIIRLNITPQPTVNAGSAQTICADATSVGLNGSVTVATGGTWTSFGTGTFSPNANTLNASYIPSESDKNGGTVTLRLTSTGNGTCNPVTSNVIITITPAPTVDAGNDQTVCNAAGISLNGTVTVASGGIWTSSGSGTFSPNASNLDATYFPSSADTSAGSVIMTLTSTGNGLCNPVSDDVTIIIIAPVPTINAGPDKTVCTNSFPIQLEGSGNSGYWSGGQGTFYPNPHTMNASYNPTTTEIANGNITLTLTTFTNPFCAPISDQVIITIPQGPTANAGPDRTVCADNPQVGLQAITTNANSLTWSTSSGNGVFSPNATSTNTTFTPTAGQISAGSVVINLSTNNPSCLPAIDDMLLTINPAILVDAGPDQTVCADVNSITLNGQITNAIGGTWSTSGTGTFVPDANTINATYIPSQADKVFGNITLRLTSTGNGLCNAVTDQMSLIITPAPTVDAGSGTMCADGSGIQLNAQFSVANGVTWSSTGSGTFSPSLSNPSVNYTPSAGDIAAGFVYIYVITRENGTCSAVRDSIALTITPTPTVTAGDDQVICADASGINLNGTVTVATGGIWTSSGGGAFVPNNQTLNATYVPSAVDKQNGNITLTLTTTGNGECRSYSDQMQLFITPAPIVNAGTDVTVCADVAHITISGTIQNATGGTWSSNGTGSFSPNNNSLNASYAPSADDRTNGSVTLRLTSTGNGLCNPVFDEMIITITPAPTVSAGDDLTVCGDVAGVGLSANFTVASGILWSASGSGNFSPGSNSSNAIYYFSANDISSGNVTINIVTTGNGICQPVSDQMIVTITPRPTADAGLDTVCTDTPPVELRGRVTAASGGSWETLGTGTFSPNANTLHATYNPSQDDLDAGRVTLILTTTGTGDCMPVSDTTVINFITGASVNAGADQTVCANNSTVSLSGSVLTATGGIWSSSGTGTFGNPTDLQTSYIPSAADTATGFVNIILTSTGNGMCSPVRDTMRVTITRAPTVNPGPGVICNDNPTVNLSASVTIATNVIWSGNGSGIFSNPNSLTTQYTPSNDDRDAGSVVFTVTSDDNGNCLPVSETVTLLITPPPSVDAGSDMQICASNREVNINGTFQNAGGAVWSTNGTGNFTMAHSLLENIYNVTDTDTTSRSVVLTLTTTDNNGCNPASDSFTLTIVPIQIVNAGTDRTACMDASTITLDGIIHNSVSGIWTSTGSGSFNNPALNNPVYTFTNEDKDLGEVKFAFATTGNSVCAERTDSMTITFTPAPTISAGPGTICTDRSSIALSGAVTVATGAVWSTSGNGMFGPSVNQLNVTYIPSATDRSNGQVNLTITSTGNGTCQPVSQTVTLNITPAPRANAGPDRTICADADAVISGTVTGATGGVWNTTGSGSFITDPNLLTVTYRPSPDDISAADVKLYLTTTGVGSCNPVSDTMQLTITPAPAINAGDDLNVCTNQNSIALNASVSVATGGAWSSTGSGTFSPNAFNLNASYIPSATDRASAMPVTLTITSTGNGTCQPVSDNMTLSFTPMPTSNAGPDQTICADADGVNLSGVISNSSGSTWSSSGTGTFSDVLAPNASYIPSLGDKNDRLVILTLTASGNNNCPQVTSNVRINITPAPTVNAGTDQTVCADMNEVSLNGNVTVATGGTWATSGSGTFSPNANALNASYVPSDNDKTSGIPLTLTLTTTGNGTCNAVSDQMTLNINPLPTANAGPDQEICADRNRVNLTGQITIAGGGAWSSSGSGTFSPSPLTLNASYIPSNTDRNSGQVLLTLTSIAGGCVTVTDQMEITITPAPTVDAGSDQIICADAGEVVLSGSRTVSSGAIWTTSGSGIFQPAAASLTATYRPSENDIESGVVNLHLTTTGNGNCNAVTDFMVLTITPAPTADAGFDQTICADRNSVNLDGRISISTGAVWTSNGSGTFSPDASALQASYIPSDNDKTNGTVILTLTTTGNGRCRTYADDVEITITPAPTVEIVNTDYCTGLSPIPLNGTVTVATGGIWSSSGTGTFSPNPYSLTATYYPSESDLEGRRAVITFTSDGNGNCNAVATQVNLILEPLPIPVAGEDEIICRGTTTTLVSGNNQNNVNYLWSTLNGTIVSSQGIIEVTVSGDSTFILTATDYKGCSVNDTVTIYVTDPPVLNLPSHYCFAEGLVIDAAPQPSVFAGNLQWMKNDTTIAGVAEATINVISSGIYVINYNLGKCNNSDTTLITTPPTVVGTDKIICINAETTLNAESEQEVSYHWYDGNQNIGNTKQVTYTTNTNRSLIIRVFDQYGCAGNDTVEITALPIPLLNITNTTGCHGETITLDARPENIPSTITSTFEWFHNNNNLNHSQNTYEATLAGTYIVNYTVGECTNSDTAVINFNPLPVSSVRPLVKFCPEGETGILDAGNANSYLWQTGETTQKIEVSVPGTYYVRIFNQHNCSVLDSVRALEVCKPRVFLPNAIIVGGQSGMNQVDVYGAYFKNFRMSIFNRWGEIIFYTESPQLVWDGYYRGEKMPIGVYPYVVYYEGEYSEHAGPYVIEGSVTVLE